MSSTLPPSAPRVRASTVRVREQFVTARFGAAASTRYRAAASPALRAVLETSSDHWVDFGLFIESTQLACTLFAEGDVGLARDIGAFGAEHNIGVWGSLVYRLLSPGLVLGLASGLWSHHYDRGKLVSRPEGKRGVRLRIEDFPTPHRLHCLSIAGWSQKTVELGRPAHVKQVETLCRLRGQDACEFVLEWG